MTTIILRILKLFSYFSQANSHCTIFTQPPRNKLPFLARMNVANSPAMGYNGLLLENQREDVWIWLK